MKFGHLLIPLNASMTWNKNKCFATANYNEASMLTLDEPQQVECPFGTKVLTVSFDKFSEKADPAFIASLPAYHKFLSASFYE